LQAFKNVEHSPDASIDISEIPKRVTLLQDKDNHVLLGCRNVHMMQHVLHCATDGVESDECMKINDPQEYAVEGANAPELIEATSMDEVIWMGKGDSARIAKAREERRANAARLHLG